MSQRWCEVVLQFTTCVTFGGFQRRQMLLRENDDPLLEPWDQDRDGIGVGRGVALWSSCIIKKTNEPCRLHVEGEKFMVNFDQVMVSVRMHAI